MKTAYYPLAPSLTHRTVVSGSGEVIFNTQQVLTAVPPSAVAVAGRFVWSAANGNDSVNIFDAVDATVPSHSATLPAGGTGNIQGWAVLDLLTPQTVWYTVFSQGSWTWQFYLQGYYLVMV